MSRRLLLAVVAAVAAASLSPALAQGPPPGGPDRDMKGETDGVRARSSEIERVRRDADKPDRKAEKSAEDKFPRIKEDFERIQIVNAEVLQAGGAPDYARLSDAAEEVRKRAARLKSDLFPPESEKKPKAAGVEGEVQTDLKSLLSALDGALANFVNSPIFQNTKVVNPRDSAKAKADLEEVIKLSARVVREADKLKKPGGG